MTDDTGSTAQRHESKWTSSDRGARSRGETLALAVCLSLGSAIALGLTRFSYALLLPSMKADLGWTFAQAGAMNTANALGYLLGALVFPLCSRRWSAGVSFIAGCVVTAIVMAVSGVLADTGALLAQRVATGISSAFIFIGGGVLAARLASSHPRDAGLVLGLYYGGAGWGIVVSAVLVPSSIRSGAHGWQLAWFALALACAVLSVFAAGAARRIESGDIAQAAGRGAPQAPADAPRWPSFSRMLGGYFFFGVGYIGYMTFIIAMLRNDGMSASAVTAFYVLLGLATVVSARLWSRLLDRMHGGQALATLNGLLALATIMPVVFGSTVVAFLSGVLFGATFLSAVASTTAFVRHNLPAARWAQGISAFTIVFAFGQIVGPMVIGLISDGAGLARGLVYSAALLAVGALAAGRQRAL
ncbi:MFS transporter [Caballeronia arationis]|jgi:predicted MFS family arabinose efflux permease|uniref:Predicted arabinose efflux permease, MFS family n=1 Tax=Caballeronia arationis TaxID=1777142 RepID=A0A7Z7N1X6_9BURK|nr:YbfB/YjiJ family MFS transporter [Caballeronia arationis]SAK54621.1 MFS transporter [Caballeronia arationis]SOE61602.1 Predicted arabinose efflux permease, MFS family [Caballeronia arationis]